MSILYLFKSKSIQYISIDNWFKFLKYSILKYNDFNNNKIVLYIKKNNEKCFLFVMLRFFIC
jgi:hypothetical protein